MPDVGRNRLAASQAGLMSSSGAITLLQVARHTAVLAVACSRCERAGRYRVDTLVNLYGPGFGVPELLRVLSADCPKRHSHSVYDLCSIHCPELSALLGGRLR